MTEHRSLNGAPVDPLTVRSTQPLPTTKLDQINTVGASPHCFVVDDGIDAVLSNTIKPTDCDLLLSDCAALRDDRL